MNIMSTLEGKLVANNMKVGIVVARFNEFITNKLLGGAMDGLLRHALQPQAEPTALEAGMTRDEDAAPPPESRAHQVFHGASPRCQRSSSMILSRRLSIGRQKPVCR